MKFRYNIFLLVAVLFFPILVQAAEDAEGKENRYRRLSLCNIMIKHDNEKFADEIEEQFLNIPVSEQYNDHNLSVRVVNFASKLEGNYTINNFVEKNYLASRLVGKWFDRNLFTGKCDMDLVKSRGLYDASAFDYELASRTTRGMAMLQDAGEDLIANTYLLMHEITYVDKAARSKMWGAIGGALMGGLAMAGGASASDAQSLMNSTEAIISSYKGFSVKITTRLYRLVWDDEISMEFYTQFYSDEPDDAKRRAFENGRSHFKLEYVGDVVSKGGKTSFLGINEEEPQLMIRKACQRALDENVADLMKKYEQFRIKAPIIDTEGGIKVQIGLKEGITPDSEFEVLEIQEKDGKTVYKRVATVKPVPNKIWDNRFMAVEEGAYGATFGYTTFRKSGGGDIYPGLLVRQIK